MLSACQAMTGSSTPASSLHSGWWREAPATSLSRALSRGGVYVAQANGSSDAIVLRYGAQNPTNKPPKCSMTGEKLDHSQIAADAAGNLYIPNIETASIDVYAPNCGARIATIHDPYGADLDVALGKGTVYGAGGTHVAVCTISGCSRELTDPSIVQLETAAVDAKGNVWATYYSQNAIDLIVWPGGAMPGKVVGGYVNQNTPGDLEFDKHGNLISLQSLFTHVYLYRCDATTASCTNTRVVNLKGGSLFGSLNARNTDYQVTGYESDEVDVYAYPSFEYKYSYNNGLRGDYSVQAIVQTQ